jgi:hypothetical protein
MVNVSKKTIQKSTLRIVRVARLIGFCMMNMVGEHVNLFGNCFNGKVLGKEAPEFIAKFISAVGAKPVVPDSTMRTHNDHAVYKGSSKEPPGKKFKNEKHQKWKQANYCYPAKKG